MIQFELVMSDLRGKFTNHGAVLDFSDFCLSFVSVGMCCTPGGIFTCLISPINSVLAVSQLIVLNRVLNMPELKVVWEC